MNRVTERLPDNSPQVIVELDLVRRWEQVVAAVPDTDLGVGELAGGGLVISSCAVRWHQLWLLYVGYGLVVGLAGDGDSNAAR